MSGSKSINKSKTPVGRRQWQVLALLFTIALFFAIAAYFKYNSQGANASRDRYYAVFLDNNQVYFGQIADENANSLRLTDIFYLQSNDGLEVEASDSKNQLTLIKLGKELHSPEDEMIINRDHLLFYEKLKENSTIINKINEYKSGNK